MNTVTPNKLIVASNSPRRQQLMSDAGFEFEVFAKDIDESISDDTPLNQVAQTISEKKNTIYRTLLSNEIILTADTVVINKNQVLGKPKSVTEAIEMLENMSGLKHQVISGVCISSNEKRMTFAETTDVYFKQLTPDEIKYYIEKFNPLDKAGAYGIQEWIGMIGVEKIIGSFYNVMGLPIHKVYEVLKEDFKITVK